MDFGWTEEQLAFRASVTRFAERELAPGSAERDAESTFPGEQWEKCARFGIQGLPVPAAFGGSDADPLTTVLAMEALGAGCPDNGLLFSLGAHMWSCEAPLVRFGTDEQKRRYLPRLCDGSLVGVQAMSEPGSGSDAFALTTRVTRSGDAYVLDGAKTFITNAPVAGVFVVFATLDPAKGWAGLCALLVDRDTPGVSVGSPFAKMGLHTSPMSEVVFSDCAVPASALLGKEGGGMAVFNASMEWERSFILATAIGTMERQLARCVEYATSRRQFGQPIGKFQSVSNRLVDMKLRLESSRLLLYRVAWLRAQGQPTAMDSALAKLCISEAFLASSLDAVQVHGGYGYMAETGLERDVRDAVAGRIYSGTSDIQRMIVARHLGL